MNGQIIGSRLADSSDNHFLFLSASRQARSAQSSKLAEITSDAKSIARN